MTRFHLVGWTRGVARVACPVVLAGLASITTGRVAEAASPHPGWDSRAQESTGQQSTGQQSTGQQSTGQANTGQAQAGQVRAGERSGPPKADSERGKRRLRGRLDEDEMEALISVASDISPKWASSLQARMAEDPESAKADFREHGRRLFGLLMLKRRNPELYTIRVAELALKKGISDQAVIYHQLLAKDPEAASELGGRLRDMVKESVDLELRARAMELEALDKAVRELRQELLSEVNDRQQRVDALWKTLIENPSSAPGDDGDPFGGFGDGEPPRRLPGRRPPGGPDRDGEGQAG